MASAASVPGMVDAAAAAAPGSGSSTLGASALSVAQTQLGVHETGVNTGAEVDKYLAAAGVGPGNPWCASFVTWSLQQAGHKMPGSGWAAVQTWVRTPRPRPNNLQVVSADQARPGDIVAYDWGHQEDFGSDGHIGFLASNVQDGKFTALEGNNHDAVMKVPRDVNMANVKFIRIGGDAPPRGSRAAAAAARQPSRPGGVADAAAQAVGGRGRRRPATPATTRRRRSSPRGWAARPRSAGCRKQLPVMASLVESGVKNLNYGDADSVGFFQMRVGIWNQGAYAGFPDKPELQVKWFLDQAEAVKKQRIARGQSVTDPKQFGDWIADIERPAEQYRGRYELRLGEANGAARPRGRRTRPPAAPVAQRAAPAAAVDGRGARPPRAGGGGGAGARALAALAEAEKYKGTPYKWGGSTPQTGFDCSGLVQWAYAKAGIQIPRVTDAQFAAANGTPVDRGDLRPGDLIFFGKPGNIYHVAISMGGDKFIHAPKTGDVVREREPQGVVLLEQLRRRAALRQQRAGRGRRLRGAAARRARQAVAEAQAAVARDAAEVNRQGSGLFMAVKAMEERRHADRPVHEGDRPEGGRRGRRPAAAAAAAAAPPPTRPPPRPQQPRPTRPSLRRRPSTPASRSSCRPTSPTTTRATTRRKDELAKWLAKQADKHGLPPELPVMASLVESGVKNINYGDADSVGFFQMRVGIWNQGDYARLPGEPRAAGQVVHRPGARGQEAGDRLGRRQLRQGPVEVGRVDRRHRAPRRAVPRPLPAAARRGARAPQGLEPLNGEAARPGPDRSSNSHGWELAVLAAAGHRGRVRLGRAGLRLGSRRRAGRGRRAVRRRRRGGGGVRGRTAC